MDDFQREVGEWADRTFPKSSSQSIASHLREEVEELEDVAGGCFIWDEDVRVEAADCFLLLLHLAHKAGFSLLDAAREKHFINRRRRWETDGGDKGYCKHIEEGVG